jgi:hypothetical protein
MPVGAAERPRSLVQAWGFQCSGIFWRTRASWSHLDARDRYRHQAHEGARRNAATFSEQLLGLHAFNPDDTGRSCLDRSRRRLQALSVAVRPGPTDRDSSDRAYSFAYSPYPPERFANSRADASSCNSVTGGHSNGSADTICEQCSRDRPADTKPHGNPSRPQLSQGRSAGRANLGRRITLSGVIQDVYRDTVIFRKPTWEDPTTFMFFDPSSFDTLRSLKEGDQITVQGEIERIEANVLELGHCQIFVPMNNRPIN